MLFTAAGCRPTYKDENLAGSIIKICKKEYKTDVKVKRIGKTLGVYVPVNGLFESKVKLKEKASLEDVLSGIKFTKDAADKIDGVSLALSRVALSTNADVDFYVLIAADTKGSGIQIVVTRYIYDMKRLILGDVSRGDYVQRLLMDVDFDPSSTAEQTVKYFFYDLQRLSSQTLIPRYFSKTTNVRVVSSNFFLYLAELDYKKQRRFYIADIKGLQIARDKVLVKCKVREIYTPAAGYEHFRFLYPSGFENEYLILLETQYMPYMIEQVVPLYSPGEKGAIERAPYPEGLIKYDDPAVWREGDFFLEEIRFPDFLARQLAGRIKGLYQTDLQLKNKFVVNLVNGEYQPAKRNFRIVFDIEKKKMFAKSAEKVDFSEIWNVISQVMRRYGYKEYDTVELLNIADANREVMTRQGLLDKFWPRWLIKR